MSLGPREWELSGRYTSWRGHRIFVRTTGDGPATLLIHGFPTSSWDWHAVWDLLAPGRKLVTLDMLGFGFSDKPRDYPYSLLGQADLIEDVLAELGVADVRIVSHDYGDSVAQELLARFEDRLRSRRSGLRIRGICFLNGGLFPETHRPLLIQRVLASPLGGLLSRLTTRTLFVRNLRSTLGTMHAISESEFHSLWELCHRGGGVHVLPQLLGYIRERREKRERWITAMQTTQVPLALVVGEADPISGAHMAARYRELLPRSPVVGLVDVGHYPQIEAPEAVGRAVTSFWLTWK